MLGKWRLYTRHYALINKEIVFPHNLKRLFKNTTYKYSMLWELLKHMKYVNFEELLRVSSYNPSIEFLIKMKLYNLALEADKITQGGNFEKRFGVSKELYPFMKKHNLTYSELEILQLYQKPNIKVIKRLLNTYHTYQLENLCQYTTIDKLLEYEKIQNKKIDLYLYADYLENAKLLGFDLKNKKYLFPEDLKTAHDKSVKQVEKYKNKILTEAVLKRYEELSKNIYKTKQYIIIPPKSKEEFISEANQQNNCVYTNYYEKYAKGISDIYFMRDLSKLDKSLVTVEVRNGKIVQSRAKYNSSPNKQELDFLESWENKVLKEGVA